MQACCIGFDGAGHRAWVDGPDGADVTGGVFGATGRLGLVVAPRAAADATLTPAHGSDGVVEFVDVEDFALLPQAAAATTVTASKHVRPAMRPR